MQAWIRLAQGVRNLLRSLHIHLSVLGNTVGPDEPGPEPASTVAEAPQSSIGGDFVEPVEPTTAGVLEPPLDWWLRTVDPDPSPEILSLARQLRPGGAHTPTQRIELAYQRGRQAAQIRAGLIFNFWGERCALRNRCYVVLRGGESDSAFFTWDYPTHQAAVRTGPSGEFSNRAISHGFPSQAEATAFCLGAGLDGLATTL